MKYVITKTSIKKKNSFQEIFKVTFEMRAKMKQVFGEVSVNFFSPRMYKELEFSDKI
jgi:hypothetical protein